MARATEAGGVRLRLVALPAEHGGWSFLAEPVLLGLLVAPAPAGLMLGVAAAGAFLLRHPLTVALGDRRRGKRYPRTAWAERFALLYALLALAGLSGALAWGAPFWQAVALAAPLAILQLAYDVRRRGRELAPELAGALALAAVAAAMALAGGWALGPALGLWGALAARAAGAVVYVRARVRRLRGEPAPAWPSLAAHALGLAGCALLAALGLAPWLAAAAALVLLARAAWGLAPGRPKARAAVIGAQELALGALTVLLIAAGVWLHL